MSFEVGFSRVAEDDVARISDWWMRKRPSAPRLFREELNEAVDLLSVLPETGAPYRPRRFKGMRRLLLRATRYHLYYEFDGSRVTIISVWSAVRGRGPELQ